MNPFGLSATGLLVWGVVAHLVADWMLQNDWMATHKAMRRIVHWDSGEQPYPDRLVSQPSPWWWDRHPAAYVHAGIHAALLAAVFGWVAAPLGLAHLVIDTRVPVAWLSRRLRQTQPGGDLAISVDAVNPQGRPYRLTFEDTAMKIRFDHPRGSPLEQLQAAHDALVRDMNEWTFQPLDMGTLVRVVVDQVWHVATIAIAALAVAA